MKKVTRVILFILFLISLPYLGKFNVKLVKGWTGTVYIRSDGSIDPVTAPISIVGNFSYILTGDIYGSLIVQRTGAIIDGWKVLINGQPVNYTILPHTTNTYLSFNYQHSTKNVIIQGTHAIPELPSTITLLPILIFTALLAIVTKKGF